ncbi:MAG: hypothetical protein ABSA79_10755 [Candidatus Bathyarchaeia archaeon]|jgi:uncharacterized membrane protein
MKVLYSDLFSWWIYSISFSIAFLVVISIYLYANRCKKEKKTTALTHSKNFAFVWVLVSLLFFYIFSIKITSALVFAAGNIVVEVILITYLLKNGKKEPEETDYR